MKRFYSILSLMLIFTMTMTAQTKIYAPTLFEPENGANNQMPDVVLDWLAVTGITLDITYEAQLATLSDFSDAITFPRTDVTSATMSDLQFGQQYYWRVRAFDAGDPSEWSEVWTFQVAWTGFFTSIPSDGASVGCDPSITWNALTGVTKYQFQIDTSYAWHVGNSSVTAALNGTAIVNEADMWAVGDGGVILHSDGTGWSAVESGTTSDLNAVCFVDATHGYAVGAGGTILFYDGTSWAAQTSPVTTELFGVSFGDVMTGFAVGAGGKIVAFDGTTWTEATSGITTDILAVDVVADNNVWACGKSKMVLHYDGAAWTSEEVGTKDYYGISFQDENNGWIVGRAGTIYRFDGAAWFQEYTKITKDLTGISVADWHGYAVGKSGTLLSLEGGWSQVSSGTTTDLYGVNAYGDNFGVVVGKSGMLIEKTDVGFNSPALKTYTLNATITGYDLSNLFFGKTYYYHFRAIHGADTSDWSQVKAMTTYASVSLNSPSNNSTVDLKNFMTWGSYSGATEYALQVDQTEAFDSPFVGYVDTAGVYLTVSHFGQDYYWRVAAENAYDMSAWSEVYHFTTTNEVELTLPVNGAEKVNSCPRFEWVEIMGTPNYEVQVSKTEDFADPVSAIVATAFMQCSSQMDKKTTFYWRVRGMTEVDTSAWSPVWNFTTEGYIGIDEYMNESALQVYPNPATGSFTLNVESFINNDYVLQVVDLAGRVMIQQNVTVVPGENAITVDLEGVSTGLYTVLLKQGDQSVSRKLMVQ